MENWEVLYRTEDGTEGSIIVPAVNRIMAFDQADIIFADMGIKPIDVSVSMISMEELGWEK